MQHKRPMLKNRIRILQGHSKEDLRQRSCGGVPRSVLNPPQHILWCCQACKTRCHISINLKIEHAARNTAAAPL